jgi:uncharacterized protein YgiB involved in biofilm formation
MKIFSEKTNKYYSTVDECVEAEKKYDEEVAAKEAKKKELSDARKNRAKEVEDAYKARLEADKIYQEKLNKFIEDYGSFHMTFDTKLENPVSFFDFLDSFLF